MSRARTTAALVPLLALVGCSGAASPPAAAVEPAPAPRELVYFEVTPAAARELAAAAREAKVDRWWVRYEMVPGGCTGVLNKLWMETAPPTDGEFEYRTGGVAVIMLKSQRDLVQGTRIDFGQKGGETGFTVTSPHAGARTKAAVSKWVEDEAAKRGPVSPADPAK
ncbi:MAG: hypothetical protein C0501_05590 [Isosphaera sp.]|nr:hypothetical protein [Isosphaera sp.]